MVKRIFILGVIIFIVCFLGYKIFRIVQVKQRAAAGVVQLPSFQYYTVPDNLPYTSASIEKNKPVGLLYFNSGCEHCQYETEQLIQHKAAVEHSTILMISAEPVAALQKFDSTYRISTYPFIKLLRDSTHSFFQTFGTAAIPAIFIYDRQHRLVQSYKGEVKPEAIIDALNPK